MNFIEPPRSEDLEWTPPEGPKPEKPGWYPASFMAPPDPRSLRWWSGSYWSRQARDHEDQHDAAYMATQPAYQQNCIYWARPWWPERAA